VEKAIDEELVKFLAEGPTEKELDLKSWFSYVGAGRRLNPARTKWKRTAGFNEFGNWYCVPYLIR
jgi:hypothetical protein